MSRLSSIKKKIDSEASHDNHYLVHNNDTRYLFYLIERYETALLKYSDMIVLDSEDHPHDVGMVAREALEGSFKEEKK